MKKKSEQELEIEKIRKTNFSTRRVTVTKIEKILYKSFKVLRQQTPGDWTLVMSKLSDHLSGLKNG